MFTLLAGIWLVVQMVLLHLNEHEAARWLSKDELDSVKWLPADLEVVKNDDLHR